MKIVMEVSCVTRVNGVAASLLQGKAYDLDTDTAKSLVAGGLAKAESKSSGQTGSTQKSDDSKPEGKDDAETKPKQARKPRTRKAPSKSQGAAPENK